jgi:hypothetical protein
VAFCEKKAKQTMDLVSYGRCHTANYHVSCWFLPMNSLALSMDVDDKVFQWHDCSPACYSLEK